MDSFCCICTKNICNCRKDEEVVTLLRSYAKQISLNAMKKIGALLLGLAKTRVETTTSGSLPTHAEAPAHVIDVVHMVFRTSKQPICRLRVKVSIQIDFSHLYVDFIMS